MGKRFTEIQPQMAEFIGNQHMFFVGTAAESGRVNVSPKGMDTFRVLGPNQIAWLNLTGSGNETAAHLALNSRMTIMFAAFEGKPLILRLYGTAKIYHPRDKEYQAHIGKFSEIAGARQIVLMDVDLVQTSCGFAVPFMDFKEDRSILKNWAEKQGQDKIEDYWAEKNTESIDGFETHILS
ncbi:pyridoxamine 5'-phosphate oxidase family protein [Pontibacter sp. G13]|uniref:pyridoxamine 5'-phosphate oxidase family protein n=1 Tax=Pontibacter sp. G13 TaxID=3074898 RepID=UPI0028891F8C|nr:pyridoxamine 5'-phosphate oxidase family protein [Pontibacter sp. G13]WNJ19111.1 pyridoxamine 5'-phosphate oxidase family protein [Pontibacter sp. G13]